jgi:hypothetical protein
LCCFKGVTLALLAGPFHVKQFGDQLRGTG